MEFDQANPTQEMVKKLMGSPFIFPNVWHSAAWFGGLFFIIIGMLFILLVTNEVQYRTHRQNIIDGWSRLDFLKAKLTMMLFFTITATLLVTITAYVCGSIHTPATVTYTLTTKLYFIGYFALMAFMYLIVAYLVSILIKRTGLAIIIYFAFVCIIDNLLWLTLTLKGEQFGFFTPLETTDSLIPNPMSNVMNMRTVTDTSLLIGTGVYIILFTYIIYKRFVQSDLKN